MDLQKKNLFIAILLIILLGALITVFSVFHTRHMGSAFLQYPIFLYGTAILSLALGGFIVYLFEEKIDEVKLGRLLAILPTNERKVMSVLFERKEIEQKKLGTLSGLKPVKLSRTISNLEQRSVLIKKKQGYTNLIILNL